MPSIFISSDFSMNEMILIMKRVYLHYLMGKTGSQVKVATLNYSGIYLNPFEYYAVDNWEELQAIGRIFERNLKRDYQIIKDTLINKYTEANKDSKEGNKNSKDGAFEAEHYSRTSFAWDVGDIDKYIHKDRYSPLYSQSDKKQDNRYAGIRKGAFQTEEQYIQTWLAEFKQLQNQRETQAMREVAKQAKKAKLDQRYQCAMLDFMCYQAILEYLYDKLLKQDEQKVLIQKKLHEFEQFQQNSNHPQISFNLNTIQKYQRINELMENYKQFMNNSFKRIDVEDKIKTTINHLFLKSSIDVVTLPEATAQLRTQIQKLENYYTFGPSERQRTKQTLMIIHKKSVLLPADYNHNQYLQQNKQLLALHNRAAEIIDTSQTPIIQQRLQKLFEEERFRSYLGEHHIASIFDQYAQKIYKYTNKDRPDTNKETKLQNDRKKIREMVENLMQQIEGPFKMRLEVEVANSNYWKQMVAYFFVYWQNRIKQIIDKNVSKGKQYKNYIDQLKQKGIFSWMIDVTIAQFPQNKLILGGFHLPSKAIKNEIVVTIIGIIVYYLKLSQSNFIFSGDFNSYISLVDKDDLNGIFHFVENFLTTTEQKADSKFNVKQMKSSAVGIYPRHPKMMTTKKKRTIMQPQVKKVNELKELCIDQIISSLQFKHESSCIGEIGEIGADKMSAKHFLPHSKHPYDHFLVYAQLALPRLAPH